MSENYIVINGKRAELTKEQLEKLGIKEKGNGRWRAEKYEKYWFVRLGIDKYGYSVDSAREYGDLIDVTEYHTHNYFQTKEEAQKYTDVLNTEIRLRKYADEHNDKTVDNWYTLYYDNRVKDYNIVKVLIGNFPRVIRFSSKEIANDAVKAIGKDKVIEYLTYEW